MKRKFNTGRGAHLRCRKCAQRFRFEGAFESHKNGCCSWPCYKIVGPSLKPINSAPEGKKLKSTVGNSFYGTREWMDVRYRALVLYGAKCACCGAEGGKLHVDHIKPRAKYPQLALDITNVQVLCRACNRGRPDTDETGWRKNSVDSTLSTPDNN